jgi:hypothetical protein
MDPTYPHLPVAVRRETVLTESGLWCARCRVATGVRVWVAFIFADQMHMQEQRRCRDCGPGTHVTIGRP